VGSTLALAHPLYYDRLMQLASTIFGTIKEVCQTVLFCLNSGRSFDTINDTNIVLIPKKKVSTRVIDFRPISLCIVIFKLVAKVLANRLK
jgi:hypothetical protein